MRKLLPLLLWLASAAKADLATTAFFPYNTYDQGATIMNQFGDMGLWSFQHDHENFLVFAAPTYHEQRDLVLVGVFSITQQYIYVSINEFGDFVISTGVPGPGPGPVYQETISVDHSRPVWSPQHGIAWATKPEFSDRDWFGLDGWVGYIETPDPVPEPASLLLYGSAALLVLWRIRRLTALRLR